MRVKLGDIFEIGSGGTPSKSHPEYYGGNIPWVKTGDLKNEYLYEVEDFITEEGLNNSSAKIKEPTQTEPKSDFAAKRAAFLAPPITTSP